MASSQSQFNSLSLAQQRIHLSHAAGECLMAWATVEHALHDLFGAQIIRQSTNKNRYFVARIIWSTVINFDVRLRLVDATIEANFSKMKSRSYIQAKKDWHLLYIYTISMSKKRNEIAHGTMMNYDNKEMRITPYATAIPVRNGVRFEEVLQRILQFNELFGSISWIARFFAAQRRSRIRRRGLLPRSIPPLVLRLRKEARDRNRAARIRQQKKKQRKPSRRKSKARR